MESGSNTNACLKKSKSASNMPIKWEPTAGRGSSALTLASTADWLKTLPAVTTLRCIWEQQFHPEDQGGHWREELALPAAEAD